MAGEATDMNCFEQDPQDVLKSTQRSFRGAPNVFLVVLNSQYQRELIRALCPYGSLLSYSTTKRWHKCSL